jgi:hypothetical protein
MTLLWRLSGRSVLAVPAAGFSGPLKAQPDFFAAARKIIFDFRHAGHPG